MENKIVLPHKHGDNEQKVLAHLPDADSCSQVAEAFKLISDGTRLRIVWLLCHCEECVGNVAAAMEMTDQAVSHHLRLLKKSGLIVSRRDGKEIYYKLADTRQAALVHLVIEEMLDVVCPLDEK
ncbi:MAG: metalloregulator ArsR/SmtB family transcription factor [Lachnospiraceae bacterium]|nr:metalloregulator ArsR/SmtB family transcription factor [Lachnospiraceae bacterium]